MVDGDEADDKIVAVLTGDLFWGDIEEIADLPARMVERLTHYFETYKMVPGENSEASILKAYGRDHAADVIRASMADYDDEYGGGPV